MINYKLGDIVTFIGGGTPSKGKKEYWNGNVPWASVKDIKSKYLISTQDMITEDGVKASATSVAEIGELIMCTRLSPGRCTITKIDTAINQDLKILRPKYSGKYLNEYMYYQLQRLETKIIEHSSGSTVKGTTIEKLSNLDIYLPSLEMQKQIVAVLRLAQSLIDKRKEAIAKLDELLKSRFGEMFGDPINNPKGWEVKKLRTISKKILSGNTPKGGSEVYVDEGIMFFRSQNVWKNKLVLDDIAYIDKETHDKMGKSSLRNRDILITKTGRINTENSSLGRAAMFLGEDDSANINGHVYLIRLQKEIVNEFVLFILTTDEYREYIRSVCVGGIDKRQINKEHLEEFPIIFPPIKLQNQFSDFVKQVNKLKFEMEAHLKEIENNFNALLQQAFKGELTIKDEINA